MIKKCEYCGHKNYFNSTGYCESCDRALLDKKQQKSPTVQIIEETEISINAPYNDTIERLIGQNGMCRDVDGNKHALNFHCDRHGDIIVHPVTDNYTCFVTAKIFEENGKAKIKIQLKKQLLAKGFGILKTILPALAIVAALSYLIVKKAIFSITTADICLFIIITFFILNRLLTINADSKSALLDLQIMKSEVIRRVKAVERWDD